MAKKQVAQNPEDFTDEYNPLIKEAKMLNGSAKILGFRIVETIVMSLVVGGLSTYIAVSVLETKVQYMEQYIERQMAQQAQDIREIRNYLLRQSQ